MAVLLTVLIVGASLALYYRTAAGLMALFMSLAAGAVVTFGLARLTIGHLNSVSAFLSSIVVGNGINFGMLVLARHLEERRRAEPWQQALARALGGSFTGTLTAALAAGIAYLSLIVTDFRGFRDFGAIGGSGMVLCWISAYTLLPALLAVFERRGMVKPERGPAVESLIARLLPRRPRRVVAGAAVVVAAAALVTWGYFRIGSVRIRLAADAVGSRAGGRGAHLDEPHRRLVRAAVRRRLRRRDARRPAGGGGREGVARARRRRAGRGQDDGAVPEGRFDRTATCRATSPRS